MMTALSQKIFRLDFDKMSLMSSGSKPPSKTIKLWTWKNAIADFISVILWVYAIFKLFIFDFDNWLLNYLAPEYSWLQNFKIIFFLGLVAAFALFAKRMRLWKWVIYVALFPFVLIFWKLPVNVAKTGSLNLVFYICFSVIVLVRNLKYTAIVSFVVLLSIASIIICSNKEILIISGSALLSTLFIGYLRRIIAAIKPGDTFELLRKLMGLTKGYVVKKVSEDAAFEQLALIDPSDSAAKNALADIEMAVTANRIFLFTAKKLKGYQNSGIATVSSTISTVLMILWTTWIYSIVYYALFKYDKGNFTYIAEPRAFNFVALSFKAMLFDGVNEIIPLSPVAQALNMLQNMSAIFIIVIFVSLLVTAKNQIYGYQIEETIKKAESDGRVIESFMLSRYHLSSMGDLLVELERLKSSLLIIIEFFTKQL